MVTRLAQVLVVLCVASIVVAVPTAANAEGPSQYNCSLPRLATPYGPLEICTEISDGRGRAVLWSPITTQFSPISEFFPVAASGAFSGFVTATDGVTALYLGDAVLATGYGATVYAVQQWGNLGRWGNVNLHTNLFYPSTGWYAQVPID